MKFHQYVNFFGGTTQFYSASISLSLLVAAFWVWLHLRRHPGPEGNENAILTSFPFLLLTSVLGAIVFDALFTGDWRTWFSNGEQRFGLTFTGFLASSLIFLAIYGRFTTAGSRWLLNFYLPLFALTQAIGRIGCFLGGCCYGIPSQTFGVVYPEGSLPCDMLGPVPLFPVQLLESGLLFLLFIGCICTRFTNRAAVYLIGVAGIRFGTEFLRYDDSLRGQLWGQRLFSPAQIMSLVFLLVGVGLFVLSRRKRELL